MTRRDFILAYVLGRMEEGTDSTVDIVLSNAISLWNRIKINEETPISLEFNETQDSTITNILRQWKDTIVKERKDTGEDVS